MKNIEKSLYNIPKWVYNKNIERRTKETIKRKAQKGETASMGKKKKQKKKPIKWQELTVNALIDLIIGTILIVIDKIIK